MKTVFIMAHVPNPRMNKRIQLLKEISDVKVICVRRRTQNIYEPAVGDVEYKIFDIDMPSHKDISGRVKTSYYFFKNAYKLVDAYKPDYIYAHGFDGLFIASKYKKKYSACKFIAEIADIREIFIQKNKSMVKNIEKFMIQILEKRVFHYVDYLVLTSEKFFSEHYKNLIDKQKVIFFPNIPDIRCFEAYHKREKENFTVGFIGAVRYIKQMKLLIDAAETAGVHILFAGGGGTDQEYLEITEYCKNKEFVTFSGKYDYNTEIAGLYSQVDCVYSVYDADNPNVRIALPNKLYEAIYCELPIIVAKGTYLQELVEKLGVGIAVDHKSVTELTDVLSELKEKNGLYNRIVDSCRKNKDMINLDTYNRQLLNCVMEEVGVDERSC